MYTLSLSLYICIYIGIQYIYMYTVYIYIHTTYWPRWLGWQNTLTASLQRGKTPLMGVLI